MGLGGHFTPDARHEVYVDLLDLAFSRGMTFVDTAEVYGGGQSEMLVGRAAAGRRDQLFIATKVSPENLCKADLIRSAEASLKRLGVDAIDLHQIHWPNPKVPIDETADALVQLVRTGKVRHVGVCNFSLKQLDEFQAALGDLPVSSVQAEYNLFDRSVERDLLPYCQRNRIALVGYSPLDQGQICGGGARRIELERMATKYGKSASQLALAWLIRQENVFVIPKAGRPEHIEQNASAADIELTGDDSAAIDRLTTYAPVEIRTDRIRVVPDDEGRRSVYTTIDEAKQNTLGLTPSPLELADDLRAGNFLKAIRVRTSADSTGRYDYDLVEGRIRYWAWVLAFGVDRPIPALVRG